MVYGKTAVAYRYSTPDTPGGEGVIVPPTAAGSAPPVAIKSEQPSPVGTVVTNRQAHAHNESKFAVYIPTKKQLEAAAAAVQPQANGHDKQRPPAQPSPILPAAPKVVSEKRPEASPQPTSSQQKPAGFAVELRPPPSFNKDEYMVVPDDPDELNEPSNLSTRKRTQDDYNDSQDAYGAGLDQRQKADAAFHEIRRHFMEIFEAEENVAATQSGSNPLVSLNNNQDPIMTPTAHQKMQPLLQKAISLGCFMHIPVDELLHIQRLSEGALKQVQELDLKVDESWGESDIQTWVRQLSDVDTGLKAARTTFMVMSGGREDKQLYSEDNMQDCLNVFRTVMENIIVPLTELRNSGSKELFAKLLPYKKSAAMTFTNCTRLFSVMTSLVASIDLSETVVNTLEFLSSQLIFVENAHADRDSVVGIQKFDGLRLVAMDMLSQIFLKNPQQRQGIFDDILVSLEKLPSGKQKARQFKLSDGKSVQPVSALILRLVQASAGKSDEAKGNQSRLLRSLEDDDDTAGKTNGQPVASAHTSSIQDEERAASKHDRAIQELQDVSTSLVETTRRNASYVINFIVQRALKSTKSGDTPYRNLLDLFVEDFTTCLDSPDWPAAELLLRILAGMMVKLVDEERTAAPAKNMALELLGTMGAAISRLRSHVKKTANSLEAVESNDLGMYLSDLAASALEMRSRSEQMLSWSGPYRATLEYLAQRCSEDPHLNSAISFLITDWANRVGTAYDAYGDEFEERDQELGRLAYRLRMMIEDRRWLATEYSFAAVSPTQAKLSYDITLVRSQFCESYRTILNILLRSMTIDQATVRSKSLKSVLQVLETDPTILDGDSSFIHLILQCSGDSSPQVRDSALGLIGKCIGLRPALEEKMIPTVIDRFVDSGVGVRKRAMKLARDIYLRNSSRTVRSNIANGLLHRVQDPDDGVREVARQMIEEIWISPFSNAEGSATFQTSLSDHVALMVHTVKQGNVLSILDKVFQTILGSKEGNFRVGKMLVSSLFDLIDNPDSEESAVPSGRDALQLLMIFAKSDAKLFTFEQIRLLKPHITSVVSSEDATVSRAVVIIYLRVLPQLSKVHAQFLVDVRNDLLPAIGKLRNRALLDDVVACLWIISGLLETSDHLMRVALSSLAGIQKIRIISQKGPLDSRTTGQFKMYSLIVGLIGKHCDLDSHEKSFKEKFPKWQGTSVSKLMVDVVIPFATPGQTLEVRKSAIDAVGLVCQTWPRNYVSANVYTAFQQVFDEQVPVLESTILRSLKEFLFTEEKRSELAAAGALAAGAPAMGSGAAAAGDSEKQSLTVMGGTSYDDVSSATTQRFLKEITRIALATQDEHAFLAIEVMASINRQGLVHPKETGVTLITLETSSVSRISEIAFQEHRSLHDKHETVLEREYAKAVQSAFVYQRDVVHDERGATTDPFSSKLHLMVEVLKASRPKNRMKFLDKLCGQVDFEPAKLDVSESMPGHVQFSQFIIENLAFFNYETVAELQATVAAMDKLVTSTGAGVAQAIESEIFQVRMDAHPDSQPIMDDQGVTATPAQPLVDVRRLRQLTAGSMILQGMWEARTYLRRQYNLKDNKRESKAKASAKDANKLHPVKVQTVTGDKFWEDMTSMMTALQSQERMMDQCRSFVDTLNVDKDFKVADEDDDMNGDELGTPSNDEDEDDDQPAERGRKRKPNNNTPTRGRKKRASSASQSTPKKRGRPKKNPSPRVDADDDDDMDYF